MQPETFVFFGIVGSGKGTQVKLLQGYLNNEKCEYIGTGEIYRELLSSPDDENAKILKEALDKGHLMPDDFTDRLVKEKLNQCSPEKHWLFDGYPRTPLQAKAFEAEMQNRGRNNIKIVYIELSEAEAMKRNLLRGRHDDTEEGLKKRFEEYRDKVIPAINYFKGKDGYTVYEINGEQSVEAVHQEIKNKIWKQ